MKKIIAVLVIITSLSSFGSENDTSIKPLIHWKSKDGKTEVYIKKDITEISGYKLFIIGDVPYRVAIQIQTRQAGYNDIVNHYELKCLKNMNKFAEYKSFIMTENQPKLVNPQVYWSIELYKNDKLIDDLTKTFKSTTFNVVNNNSINRKKVDFSPEIIKQWKSKDAKTEVIISLKRPLYLMERNNYNLIVKGDTDYRIVYRTSKNSSQDIVRQIEPLQIKKNEAIYNFFHAFSKTTIWMALEFYKENKRDDDLTRTFYGDFNDVVKNDSFK